METAKRMQVKQAGMELIESWGLEADRNLEISRRALKTIDKDGSLAQVLNETGFGDHPAVLSFMYNLGRQLQEGGFFETPTVQHDRRTRAQRMYPTMEK